MAEVPLAVQESPDRPVVRPLRARRIFSRFVVALTGTAVVLLTLLVLAGFREVADSARRIDPRPLVPAALILAGVMPPLAAARWYLILRRCGAGVRFAPLLRSYIVTNVLNLFMPGPVGDLTVTTHLEGQEGVPVGTGFASLMLAKVSMGLVNILFLAAALPVVARFHLEPSTRQALSRGVIAVLVVVGVIGLVAVLPRASVASIRRLFRSGLDRISSRAARRAGEAVDGFTAAFMSCVWTTARSPGLLVMLGAIAVVKTGLLVVAFMLVGASVGLHCQLWDGVFLAPSYTFLLLSSTWIPGAVGPPELFLVGWAAGLAGHQAGDGVLFGLVVKVVILVGALGSTGFLLPGLWASRAAARDPRAIDASGQGTERTRS